jgi:uncharacterized coiled-coil protein SlyX
MRTLEESITQKMDIALGAALGKALEKFTKDFRAVMADEFSVLSNKIMEQNKTIQAQDKTIDALSAKVVAQNDHVNNLQTRVNDLEQAQLANNIELHGVPEEKGENVWNVVCDIAEAIDAKDSMDGAYCYRARKVKNKPAVIVIRFKYKEDKELWLQGRKKDAFKNYTMPNLYSDVASNTKNPRGGRRHIALQLRVFEQVTYYTRQLLYETQKTAAEKGFKFVWTKGGKIFVRKDEDTKALIKITKHEDITTKLVLNDKNTKKPIIEETKTSGDATKEGENEGENENGEESGGK